MIFHQINAFPNGHFDAKTDQIRKQVNIAFLIMYRLCRIRRKYLINSLGMNLNSLILFLKVQIKFWWFICGKENSQKLIKVRGSEGFIPSVTYDHKTREANSQLQDTEKYPLEVNNLYLDDQQKK